MDFWHTEGPKVPGPYWGYGPVQDDGRVWDENLERFLYVFFRENTWKVYGAYRDWYGGTK